MTFDTCIKVCIDYPNQDVEHFHHSKKFSCARGKIPFPHPRLLAILNLSSVPIVLTFFF